MPEKETIERARRDKREGKSASTQAGEFVREEMHHVREGKHGARSTKQAIAIGLSKARRAGVRLPRRGQAAKTATKVGGTRTTSKRARGRPSARRSKAVSKALRREGHSAASPRALGGAPKDCRAALGVGEEGVADKGASGAEGGCTQSRPHTRSQSLTTTRSGVWRGRSPKTCRERPRRRRERDGPH